MTRVDTIENKQKRKRTKREWICENDGREWVVWDASFGVLYSTKYMILERYPILGKSKYIIRIRIFVMDETGDEN